MLLIFKPQQDISHLTEQIFLNQSRATTHQAIIHQDILFKSPMSLWCFFEISDSSKTLAVLDGLGELSDQCPIVNNPVKQQQKTVGNVLIFELVDAF